MNLLPETLDETRKTIENTIPDRVLYVRFGSEATKLLRQLPQGR